MPEGGPVRRRTAVPAEAVAAENGWPGRGPRPKLYGMQEPQREEIGLPAARDGRFPAAWKRDRMTWVIKPRSQTS